MVIFIDEKQTNKRINRDTLYKLLNDKNIQTKKYFYPAVHNQAAYKKYLNKYKNRLRVTKKASISGLALPLYGHIKKDDVLTVCREIKKIFNYERN